VVQKVVVVAPKAVAQRIVVPKDVVRMVRRLLAKEIVVKKVGVVAPKAAAQTIVVPKGVDRMVRRLLAKEIVVRKVGVPWGDFRSDVRVCHQGWPGSTATRMVG